MANASNSIQEPAMSTAKRKRKKNQGLLLSSTRPHQLRSAKSFHPLPSSTGRTLIRTHHTLQKRLTAAIARHDATTEDLLRAEIETLGGLERYQDASLAGQSKERGGDTSSVLVEWLSPYKGKQLGLRILEVGALSMKNMIAQSKIFDGGMERIDLKSRHPEIKEQDFLDRPLPESEADFFDVVSLSLVVNYVGDAQGRGEMLRRVGNFLRTESDSHEKSGGSMKGNNREEHEVLSPALFLVLPAPCVNNSRYLDGKRLTAMLETLGYSLVRQKLSAKLVYYLWLYRGLDSGDEQKKVRPVFRKEEIRKGKDRNNFAIVLR